MKSRIHSFGWVIAALSLSCAAALGACDTGGGGDKKDDPDENPGCPDDAQFFQDRVFAPILSQKCIVCHSSGGVAAKSDLVLEQEDTAEARQANFETVRDLARMSVGSKSVLLLRPTGLHPEGHPGGKLVDVGTSEYAALSSFVDRVTKGKCDSPTVVCDGPARGGRMLRRLSRSEYDATISDLFGIDSAWGAAFSADTVVNGFDNNASALVVSPLLADQARRAAEEIAEAAFKDPSALLPCDAASGDAACAGKFIESFGKRAFRRPLSGDDQARYLALYTKVAAEDGFLEGVKTVVIAMLQSPHFLYRSELGGEAKDGIVTLAPHEVAAELSYLFWGTMPDAELFAAADAGKLASTEQIAAQAERLLADPRSDAVLDRFVEQWLLVGNVVNVPKDEAVYPGFSPAIRAAMREETRALFRHVLRGEKATLPALLTADRSYVSPELATFYGVSGTTGADGLIEVDLSGSERAGVLTQGSVLATHAHPNDSSPIHRGKLVRTRVLCQDLPPPPAGFNVQPPPLDPSLTTRERYSAHASKEPCKSCHTLIDPIGFGFERFDGAGRFRQVENGKPIDAAGEILASAHSNGEFDGTLGLAAKLSESEDTSACFSLQWLRFAYGIAEGPDTQCLAEEVAKGFKSDGQRIDKLIVSLAGTRHFTERAADADVSEDPGSGGAGGAGGGGGNGGSGQGGSGEGGSGEPVTQDLSVNVHEDSKWQTGYCSTVTVTNNAAAPVTWEISLDIEGMMTDVWNAESSPDGAKIKFVGVNYNATLDTGEMTSFGFCASL